MNGPIAPFGLSNPPSDPRALAVRILSEPRFRERVFVPPKRMWWDWAWQWFTDRWNSLVDAFSRNVHVGKHLSAAIGDMLIVATIGLVGLACIRLAMRLVREQNAAGQSKPLESRATARELYAQALQAAEQGKYGPAIVLLFRSTLAALDVRHAVDDAPSHTVNECRRKVRQLAPQLSATFDSIARAFTAVAYAGAPAGQADWSAVRNLYDAHFAGREDEA
jgi:hypothetical protein